MKTRYAGLSAPLFQGEVIPLNQNGGCLLIPFEKGGVILFYPNGRLPFHALLTSHAAVESKKGRRPRSGRRGICFSR